MSSKIYKSAMGRSIDMGALLLQNENTRAVGNMKVNARGDLLNDANKVVETKNKQVQRHYQRQVTTNTTEQIPTSSTKAAKQQHAQKKSAKEKIAKDTVVPTATSRGRGQRAKEKVVKQDVLEPIQELVQTAPIEDIPEIESMEELAKFESTIPELIEPVAEPAPVEPEKSAIPRGGLAAAMAKSQSVKQELMKTQRQLAQGKPGVNKI